MKLFILLAIAASFYPGCKNRHSDSQLNVTDGKELTPNDPGFYAAVSLVTKSTDAAAQHYCSGIFVEDDIIVTSANCQRKGEKGFVQFNTAEAGQGLSEQEASFQHPLFSGHYYFDVAWLRAKETEKLKAEHYIPVLQETEILNTPDKIEDAIVIGTGVSSPDVTGKAFYGKVRIKGYKNGADGRAMIRAESLDSAVCFGDNGGPLLVKTDGRWWLAGVLHGYDYANKFDHTEKITDANDDFPSNSELCRQNSDLIFSDIGYHLAWVRASSQASNPERVEIRFKESERHGDDFKAWCDSPEKSDLAWLSIRLLLDELRVNTCEDAYKKLTESKSLELEFGALAKAHPDVIKALMTLATESSETLALMQYYNDRHKMDDFVALLPKFTKIKTLKIENYVGYQSYDFINALSEEQKKQLKTLHFLPSITPDFDQDGEGRRDDAETALLGSFPELTELYAAYNGLQTASFLTKLPKLEVLNLDFNNIKSYKEVLTLKSLKQLSMVVNPLDAGAFEKEIKEKMPELKYQIGNAP